jgi:hypothetical protein
MDTGLKFTEEQPSQLVFTLGAKAIHDYIVKSYEEVQQGGKCPYAEGRFRRANIVNYALETKFSAQLKANVAAKPQGLKGLFNLDWLRRFRFWVGLMANVDRCRRFLWRSSIGAKRIRP